MLRLVIDKGNSPSQTGIGIFSDILISSLRKYCANELETSEAGISHISRTFRPCSRLVYSWRLNRLRRSGYHGADALHFTNIYVPPRLKGVAYVATIHDLA